MYQLIKILKFTVVFVSFPLGPAKGKRCKADYIGPKKH